jgi:serine/threonine protein kinase
MRSISHPNIVNFEGIFETDETVDLVFEIMDGGDLCHIMEKVDGEFKEEELAYIFD